MLNYTCLLSFFAMSALAAGILCGCATTAPSSATDATILLDAKSRSASYCAKTEHGCDIKVALREDGGWTAWVVPIVMPAPDGRRYVAFDTDDMYFYGRSGTFEGALRGYK